MIFILLMNHYNEEINLTGYKIIKKQYWHGCQNTKVNAVLKQTLIQRMYFSKTIEQIVLQHDVCPSVRSDGEQCIQGLIKFTK